MTRSRTAPKRRLKAYIDLTSDFDASGKVHEFKDANEMMAFIESKMRKMKTPHPGVSIYWKGGIYSDMPNPDKVPADVYVQIKSSIMCGGLDWSQHSVFAEQGERGGQASEEPVRG